MNLPVKPVDKPPTRFEAQVALGLFAAHDYAMAILCVVSLVVIGLYTFLAVEPNWFRVLACLCGVVIFQLAWLVVLVYRAMVFVLDLHAEIALMPEAAARIAVGFLQGKPLSK